MSAAAWESDTTIAPVTKTDRIAAWLSARTAVDAIPIRHPVIDTLGLHPTSDYAWFWLPIIGPSGLLVHRRLTAGFANPPTGYRVDLSTLSGEIGLGAGVGRNAPIIRTVARLLNFHLAEIVDDRLGVYTRLPPLTVRQAARLPDHLAGRHQQCAERTSGRRTTAGLGIEAG